jgi:hypothetical protein
MVEADSTMPAADTGVHCEVFLRYASAGRGSSLKGADHNRWVTARWLSATNDVVRRKVVALRLFLLVELSFKFKMSGIRCRNGAWCGWS